MADEDSAAAELQELTDDFFDVVGSEEGDFDVKDAVVYVAYEKGLTADGSNFLWRVQTRRSSRGKNFAGACISFKLEGEPAELQVRRNNDSAQRAYQKASFEFCEPSLEFPLHGRLNGRGQTVYLAMSTPAVKKVEPLQPLKFFVRAASTLSEAEFELMVHLTMKEEGHKVSKAYAEKVVKGAGEMRYVFGVLDTAAAEPGSDRCLSRTLARPDITQRPLPSMAGWPSETAQGDHTHTRHRQYAAWTSSALVLVPPPPQQLPQLPMQMPAPPQMPQMPMPMPQMPQMPMPMPQMPQQMPQMPQMLPPAPWLPPPMLPPPPQQQQMTMLPPPPPEQPRDQRRMAVAAAVAAAAAAAAAVGAKSLWVDQGDGEAEGLPPGWKKQLHLPAPQGERHVHWHISMCVCVCSVRIGRRTS